MCLVGLVRTNRILVIYEKDELDILELFKTNVDQSQVTIVELEMNHEEETEDESLCSKIGEAALALIVDLSWSGWSAAKQRAQENGIPYLHVEASNQPFVKAIDDFLYQRSAIDAALLFETEVELDQSLYHIIGHYRLRVLVLSMTEPTPFTRMSRLRPIPSAFVTFGTTQQQTKMLDMAIKKKLVRRDSRWNFVVEDFDAPDFAVQGADVDIIVASMTEENCCQLAEKSGSDCTGACPSGKKPKFFIVKKAAMVISNVVSTMNTTAHTCSASSATNQSREDFHGRVKTALAPSRFALSPEGTFNFPLKLQFHLIHQVNNTKELTATWTEAEGVQFETKFENKTIPRYFRVGMSVSVPWLYEKIGKDGKPETNADGDIIYEGYCMDLLDKISSKLAFEYEVVISEDTRPGFAYGKKDEKGEWTGMIGDLARGDTDLVVADLTMTSEREEVIDFVSPYFDQAGISIVLRKRVRDQSWFKFLSVLKNEVWLGIIGAVITTAVLIWLLDRYSPYSARNNKTAYPYPCRDFTLKESFWFALTSLTPQGGGEAPKALSGRVLVAAYWLFVVLMLATFTANLAAFLTVERMQSTVQNLEELARQSRINYTVVSNTTYMEYFVNMAGAEDELYHKWKELTLNSSGNPAKYRVWDYPIREQFTHILKIINDTGPVRTTQEGFDNVLKDHKGEYAFIHDAARIKYEVYNNCNLTEVGEPFAEQPYALAVQQGSHLQEELSRVILELQKDRYFESLQSQYWNSSSRTNCPVLDDSEGITLQSLGGVFIATLIGLGLALVTLSVEVVMQKRKEKNKIQGFGPKNTQSGMDGLDNDLGPPKRMKGMPSIIGN
eukprot:snap_masked-scaffold1253_size52701-processed-gene-0.2 protein:Tk01374 transcript:snap_masked-scaffold1253_size52701-processed-gene-0.2-mRNA-1 annotation:"ionotropic receptor 8a"